MTSCPILLTQTGRSGRGPIGWALILYGMVIGMATSKITITLPDGQLEEIRALVGAGKSDSVSAFVKHAVRIALDDAAGWRQMLEEALQLSLIHI